MVVRPLPLAVALAFGLAFAPVALAVDVQSDAAIQSNKSLGDYLADLGGSEDPDRLFAARVLHGELKRALKTEARAKPGSIAQLDARALLVELLDRLPRACASAIRYQNTTATCADIHALLEDPAALPILREVLGGETRKGVRKRLEAAIAALAPLEDAAAPPAPPLVPAPVPPPADPPGPLPGPTPAQTPPGPPPGGGSAGGAP